MRLRDPDDGDAWGQFHDLYSPMIFRYALARGLPHQDAEDVRSACYEAVVRHIRHFQYDQNRGGFKAWLRTLVATKTIDLIRKRREANAGSGELRELQAEEPGLDEVFEQEWKLQHLRYCVEQIRGEVPEQTYQAFQMLARDGESVPAVCEKLGMNANQVYKAKSRVLQLVRERMAEFSDSST